MRLLDPSEINQEAFSEFIAEFKSAGEDLVPYSLNQNDMDFETYITALKNESLGKGIPAEWVPASTFFLVDDQNQILGAVNIRHRLTVKLKDEGGHIGYGIRPKARNQGLGTEILRLALEKIIEMGIKKALLTCDKGNLASARVIQKNGGLLESETVKEGRIVQRYWIKV